MACCGALASIMREKPFRSCSNIRMFIWDTKLDASGIQGDQLQYSKTIVRKPFGARSTPVRRDALQQFGEQRKCCKVQHPIIRSLELPFSKLPINYFYHSLIILLQTVSYSSPPILLQNTCGRQYWPSGRGRGTEESSVKMPQKNIFKTTFQIVQVNLLSVLLN